MKIRKHIIAVLGVAVMSIGLPTQAKALKLAEVDNEEITIEETSEGLATGRTVPYYNLTTSGGTWNGTYYKRNGKIVKDSFFCDGTYTYYLQADGTPMKNRLTYHPDGVNYYYMDETDGHYHGSFPVNTALSNAKECFNLINAERRRLGVAELIWDDRLYGGCQIRACEIIALYSHTRPDGSSWDTVFPAPFDLYIWAECIYLGTYNPQQAFNEWKNSPLHYAIMTGSGYTRAAVAVYGNGWVLVTATVR